jgi:hypothetical protein
MYLFCGMKFNVLFITLGCLVLIYACTKENNETKFKMKTVGPCDSVSFSKHVMPIIDLNCTAPGCHGDASLFGDFTSYDKMVPYIPQFRQHLITNPDMPKGNAPLPQDQLKIIACWLDTGAKNN